MKKAIILFSSIFIINGSFGSSLEFNQVLLLDYHSIVNATGTFIVPIGKIWKIAAVGLDGSCNSYAFIRINGNQTLRLASIDVNDAVAYNVPFWLPESTTIENPQAVTGCLRWLSIIEYNIVP